MGDLVCGLFRHAHQGDARTRMLAHQRTRVFESRLNVQTRWEKLFRGNWVRQRLEIAKPVDDSRLMQGSSYLKSLDPDELARALEDAAGMGSGINMAAAPLDLACLAHPCGAPRLPRR
jgi:hypothetical protein